MVRLSKDEALQQLENERALSSAFGGCVMCRLASHSHAQLWLAENTHGVVVLDGFGSTRGHLLVIAKDHVERTSALTAAQYQALQDLAWQANVTLEAELRPERIYTATLGASRPLPMSFPHFHTHVVPVFDTDERARPANVFSWSSGVVRYLPEEFVTLQAQLTGAWRGPNGRRIGGARTPAPEPHAEARRPD